MSKQIASASCCIDIFANKTISLPLPRPPNYLPRHLGCPPEGLKNTSSPSGAKRTRGELSGSGERYQEAWFAILGGEVLAAGTQPQML